MTCCKAIGCRSEALKDKDFCLACFNKEGATPSLSDKYPEQYREVGEVEEVDAFYIHQMFGLQDPSGCIQHASRKLLVSGPPAYRDILEARDTLTRWLQINKGMNT